jgi:hypothetical protein
MVMRSAAAVLLLTLFAPSILTMVCGATCVHQEHHAGPAAAEQGCHEQVPSGTGDPALLDGSATVCHEHALPVTAISAEVRIQYVAPAAGHRAPVSALDPWTSVAVASAVVRRSNALPATPLRI